MIVYLNMNSDARSMSKMQNTENCIFFCKHCFLELPSLIILDAVSLFKINCSVLALIILYFNKS